MTWTPVTPGANPSNMQRCFVPLLLATLTAWAGAAANDPAPTTPPPVPRFSLDYLDRAVLPGVDFYQFADGTWLKHNPVPADKARWGSFTELAERNAHLIHGLLAAAAAEPTAVPTSPRGEVGAFFAAAMDTNRLEALAFAPLADDLRRIEAVDSPAALLAVLADFHQRGVRGLFAAEVSPDAKNSAIYAFELDQGGLSLPDRDYYLKESFAPQREAYRAHVTRMLTLLGETSEAAAAHAATVLDLETRLAQASRTRVALRDPNKNYNKFLTPAFLATNTAIPWSRYLADCGLVQLPYVIVGQPEFFTALNQLLHDRPLADWQVYLRWHLLHASAPFLQRAVEEENFAFFGRTLSGQPEQEPRWLRAAAVIDRSVGEALGQLYVEKYFPPTARARMNTLVEDLKVVFRDHLQRVTWMSDATRAKALAKFARFSTKIGYPDKFRDYSAVVLRRDDYLGDVRRAAAFEAHREFARVGQPVDRAEWHMTPPTVNAYFNPLQNEIVFPAGILQPPFFDMTMDDAVNYGAIGVVIGHEITHGYDDEGRQFDAEGNLQDWWTPHDAQEFDARAQKVVDQYNAYSPLPGLHVNGKLTLGENLADLGGVTIAYDAL